MASRYLPHWLCSSATTFPGTDTAVRTNDSVLADDRRAKRPTTAAITRNRGPVHAGGRLQRFRGILGKADLPDCIASSCSATTPARSVSITPSRGAGRLNLAGSEPTRRHRRNQTPTPTTEAAAIVIMFVNGVLS